MTKSFSLPKKWALISLPNTPWICDWKSYKSKFSFLVPQSVLKEYFYVNAISFTINNNINILLILIDIHKPLKLRPIFLCFPREKLTKIRQDVLGFLRRYPQILLPERCHFRGHHLRQRQRRTMDNTHRKSHGKWEIYKIYFFAHLSVDERNAEWKKLQERKAVRERNNMM